MYTAHPGTVSVFNHTPRREEMTLLAAVPTGCGMCSTNQIGRKYYYTRPVVLVEEIEQWNVLTNSKECHVDR